MQKTNTNCYFSKKIESYAKVTRKLDLLVFNSFLFISDDDEVSKTTTNEDSSEDNDNGMKDDDTPTDDVSGDEFIPKPTNSIDQSSTKGSRVFAKWIDGHFYPGVIGNIGSEK